MKKLIKQLKLYLNSKKLSTLEFTEEFYIPSIDTGDAQTKIHYDGRLNEYKKEFIEKFGDVRVNIDFEGKRPWFDQTLIIGGKKFKTWKKDYCDRKSRAMNSGKY